MSYTKSKLRDGEGYSTIKEKSDDIYRYEEINGHWECPHCNRRCDSVTEAINCCDEDCVEQQELIADDLWERLRDEAYDRRNRG